MFNTRQSRPAARWPLAQGQSAILALLLILLLVTLLLRLWSLNSLPPWLWWDEATQGLDARDLLHGHFQVFFPRAQGKEPLYIYLSTPFVAAWDGEPFAVRIAGALLGGLMIPALYFTGRGLRWRSPAYGTWLGLAGAGLWATNFWSQSINRIGFQVNAMPLVLTLAVATWLNWTHRPSRRRAIVFGALAGLTLATYLAARITPLLWVVLYLTLPRARRQALKSSLPWAVLALACVAAPLVVYFLLRPADAVDRVSMFANLYQEPTLGDQARLLLNNVRDVFGGFLGLYGDPIPRHNIPNRPPFSPPLGLLFGLGIVMTAAGLWPRGKESTGDRQGALTLLAWCLVLSVPAILSANSNPHFPRLLSALPAALLLAAWPLAWGATRLGRWRPQGRIIAGVSLAVFLVAEGAVTANAYFVTWGKNTDLYTWYQGDMWTIGEQVAARPGSIAVIPADPSSGDGLEYAYRNLPISHVDATGKDLEAWLAGRLGGEGGTRVVTPSWQEEPYVYADPQSLVPFYLAREGTLDEEKPFHGFDLLAFTLGKQPQFEAAGQSIPLDQSWGAELALKQARWGAASPNLDRNGTSAAAGTPIWLILTWQMPQPLDGLRVAIDVVDAEGHRVATSERPLISEASKSLPWPAGGTWQTYHLVTLPPTQPPGPVSLEARVYHADTLAPVVPGSGTSRLSVPVGQAVVAPTLGSPAPVALDRPVRGAFGSDLTLLGLAAWPESVAPGQRLTLQLFWQVTGPAYTGPRFTIALGDGTVNAPLALPAGVPAGQVIHTYVDLRLPPDAPAGPEAIRLVPVGGAPVMLGQVVVAGRPRQFEAPPLTMPLSATFGDAVGVLGIDAASTEVQVHAGQPLTVTVVWRPLETPGTELARFVHVLGPDKVPVAQRDGAPCDGSCPAPSWLPGEVLTDRVRIDIPEDLPPGVYPLAAGWYDPARGRRLPAADSAGTRLPDDLLLLPLRVRVAPAHDQEAAP